MNIRHDKRLYLCLILIMIVIISITFTACEDNFEFDSITINYYSEGVLEHTETLMSGTPTPPELEREGYELVGWYLDEDFDALFDVSQAFSGVINVYAKWGEEAVEITYTITYLDWDDTVLKTETISEDESPTPPEPTREGYNFTGWSEDISSISADITITATYSIKSFSVSFVNYDGTVLKTQTVTYGAEATPPSTNPIKEDENETNYVFMGWDGDYTNITSDIVLKAEFDVVEGLYATVTFKNGSAVIKTQTVNIGEDATAPIEIPTKSATAEFRYEFIGWDIAFNNVVEDITVNAQFAEISREYTVTFINDGEVYDTQSVGYGQSATMPAGTPEKIADAQYTYEFSEWVGDYSNIVGDTTITASYDSIFNYYTVTFINDGEVYDTQSVGYGQAATTPVDPEKAADAEFTYVFSGWDGDYSNVTGATTINADYNNNLNYYTVTFINDGEVYDTQSVGYGQSATMPAGTPEKAADLEYSYSFISWDNSYNSIVGNTDVNAVFDATLIEYTVSFYSNAVLSEKIGEDIVNYNKTASAPEYTPPEGYDFVSWSESLTEIQANISVYPIIAKKTYTVTFKDGDVTLDTQSVEHGASANPPSDPQKAEDDYFTYEFSGWDKSVDNITDTTIVNATYTSIEKYYTIIFNDYNGAPLGAETVKAGEDVNAPSPTPPEGYHLAKWIDKITRLEVSTKHIISDYELEAVYELNVYTVQYVDYNGALIKEEAITHGQNATAPTLSQKIGFELLIGGDADWDDVAVAVTNDITITAIRIPINYKELPEEEDCAVIIHNSLDEYIGAYLSLEAAIVAAEAGDTVIVIDTVTLCDDLVVASGIKVMLKNDNELLVELFSNSPDPYDLDFFDYDTLEMDSLIEINGVGSLTFEDGAEVEESIFFIVDYEKEGGYGEELLAYLTGDLSPVPSVFPYFPFDSYSLNGIKTELIIEYGAVYSIAPVFVVVNFMEEVVGPFLPVNDFVKVEVKPLISSDKGGNNDGLVLLTEGATFSKKYEAGRVVCALVGNAITGDFGTTISHGEDSSLASVFKGLDTPIVIESFPFFIKDTIDLIMINAEVEIELEVIFGEGATLLVDSDSILIINNIVLAGDTAITIDGVLEIASLGALEGSVIAGIDGATIYVYSEQDDLFGKTVFVGTIFIASGGQWIEQ